jgi:hypothetical protein
VSTGSVHSGDSREEDSSLPAPASRDQSWERNAGLVHARQALYHRAIVRVHIRVLTLNHICKVPVSM